jgi:hypothetical protein
MEMHCILFEAEPEFLNIIFMNFMLQRVKDLSSATR